MNNFKAMRRDWVPTQIDIALMFESPPKAGDYFYDYAGAVLPHRDERDASV